MSNLQKLINNLKVADANLALAKSIQESSHIKGTFIAWIHASKAKDVAEKLRNKALKNLMTSPERKIQLQMQKEFENSLEG